jgi:hypothetical protein
VIQVIVARLPEGPGTSVNTRVSGAMMSVDQSGPKWIWRIALYADQMASVLGV